MHQTKKDNQWHFGMKAHIGVDVASGVVHTLTGTAANEADINQTAALLHGQEEVVFADAGYAGANKRPELADRDVSWNIAIKRSIIKALPKALRELASRSSGRWHKCGLGSSIPSTSSRTCSGIRSCATRGIVKNTAQLHTLFALANLVIVRKPCSHNRLRDHTRALPRSRKCQRPEPRSL
jgi:transposase, IS5 family